MTPPGDKQYKLQVTLTITLDTVITASTYAEAARAAIAECRTHGDIVDSTIHDTIRPIRRVT